MLTTSLLLTVILFAVSISSTVINNAVMNGVSKRSLKGKGDMLFFNFIAYAVCVVIFAAIAVVQGRYCLFSAWFGALFGIVTAVNSLCCMMALQSGPMHITLLVTTSSMLIPTFYDVIMGRAGFNLYQFIATLVLVVCIYLSVSKGRDTTNKVNFKWLLYCAASFFLGGFIGVMQKLHGQTVTNLFPEDTPDMNALFLACAFISSTLFSLFTSKGQKRETPFTAKLVLLGGLSGVCVFTMNYLNLNLANALPSQFFFPVVNGTMVVASSVLAVSVFGEKLIKRQFIGMTGGLLSLIAICLLG